MQLFNRTFTPSKFVSLGFSTLVATMRTIALFKRPVTILKNYLTASSPSSRLLEMRNGKKIFLSGHPHDVITAFIIFGRKDYGDIKKGSLIIDIGGNIGTFALFAALNGARKVYAFEPNSESFQALNRNVAANNLEGIVVPLKLAITGTSGEKMMIPKKSSPYNAVQPLDRSNPEMEEVDTLTLDQFCKDEKIDKIDLIKVDCEGAEFHIIPTLSGSLLSKVQALKVEYQDGDVNLLINHLKKNSFNVTKHVVDERMNGGMLWMEK